MGFLKEWFDKDFVEYRPGDEFSVNVSTEPVYPDYVVPGGVEYRSKIEVYLVRNGRVGAKPYVDKEKVGTGPLWQAEAFAQDQADEIVAAIAAGTYKETK